MPSLPPLRPRATAAPRAQVQRAANTLANKRPRKDRGPNWSLLEIAALISAKREIYIRALDTIDARDLFDPETSQWARVSDAVMKAGHSPCIRDGPSCKTKWNLVIPDYRRIADFHARTGTNEEAYWTMNAREHQEEGLPRTFNKQVYHQIHSWYGQRPQMNPPHVRDLLNANDDNFHATQEEEEEEVEESVNDMNDSSAPENQHRSIDLSGCSSGCSPFTPTPNIGVAMNSAAAAGYRAGTSRTPQQCGVATLASPSTLPHISSSPVVPSASVGAGMPVGGASPSTPITVPVIHLSDASESASRRKGGTTGIRRKTISSHAMYVDVARANGEIMVQQLKDMSTLTRETEHKKMDIQLRLFSEHMDFLRTKDRRLHETSLLANQNALVAIQKQGELVKCLADIANVLGKGLGVFSTKETPPPPPTPLPNPETPTTMQPPQATPNIVEEDK